MSVDTAHAVETAPTPSSMARPWLPLALIGACAAAYALFLLLPFYGNGLHHEPLNEILGGDHDPKGLWPRSVHPILDAVWALGGAFAVTLGPLVAGMSAVIAAALLAARRRFLNARDRAWLIAAIVSSVPLMAVLFSEFTGHLMTWWMD